MRKQLLFTTIIATLVLCACAKEKTVSDDVSTEENRTVSDGVSIEENSDLAASQEETDVIDHTKSPKSREEVNIDAESAALYDKFLANEVKTTFYKKGDNSDLYFLSAFLKDGENYTLSEIIDGEISYRRDKYQENLKFDVFKDSYIDCGLDGDIEMVVEIYFEESHFPLYMIIKNVAGSLKVCFAGSNSGRKGTDIEYNGVVSEYGGRIKADGLDNFYDLFIDPMTEESLKYYHLPTDYIDLLIYGSSMLADNKYTKHTDARSRRLRRYQLISVYTYQVLANAYGEYMIQDKHTNNPTFAVKQSAVIDAFLTDNITSDDSYINALRDVETTNSVTTKGPSGMNSDRAYTLDKRAYDESMINVLGMSTGFAGNVGITRQATKC